MSSAQLRPGKNSRSAKRDSQDSSFSSESVDILKLCGENQLIEEFYSQTYCDDVATLDQQIKSCNPSAYSYKDMPSLMFETVVGDGSHETPVKTDAGGFLDFEYYSHLDPGDTNKVCSKLDSEWIGVEKAEPWWRTADKELAASSFPKYGCIASSDHSWRQCLGSESYNCSQFSNQVSIAEMESLVTLDCYPGHHLSQNQQKILCVGKGCSTPGSGQSVSGDDNLSIANILSAERQPGSSDLSKGQLLEALCHSQTRAREAEQLAQQAYNEKEHVIKLFFRQASHLFAYRQWLQILQLEALVLQLRNKDEQDNSINYSTFFPIILSKGRKLKKFRYNKPIKRKPGKGKCKTNKSAVAFALGLSLAGAGLLLGWTMGWLFPAL